MKFITERLSEGQDLMGFGHDKAIIRADGSLISPQKDDLFPGRVAKRIAGIPDWREEDPDRGDLIDGPGEKID